MSSLSCIMCTVWDVGGRILSVICVSPCQILQQHFLTICWNLTVYGSAFFRGYIQIKVPVLHLVPYYNMMYLELEYHMHTCTYMTLVKLYVPVVNVLCDPLKV